MFNLILQLTTVTNSDLFYNYLKILSAEAYHAQMQEDMEMYEDFILEPLIPISIELPGQSIDSANSIIPIVPIIPPVVPVLPPIVIPTPVVPIPIV